MESKAKLLAIACLFFGSLSEAYFRDLDVRLYTCKVHSSGGKNSNSNFKFSLTIPTTQGNQTKAGPVGIGFNLLTGQDEVHQRLDAQICSELVGQANPALFAKATVSLNKSACLYWPTVRYSKLSEPYLNLLEGNKDHLPSGQKNYQILMNFFEDLGLHSLTMLKFTYADENGNLIVARQDLTTKMSALVKSDNSLVLEFRFAKFAPAELDPMASHGDASVIEATRDSMLGKVLDSKLTLNCSLL